MKTALATILSGSDRSEALKRKNVSKNAKAQSLLQKKDVRKAKDVKTFLYSKDQNVQENSANWNYLKYGVGCRDNYDCLSPSLKT